MRNWKQPGPLAVALVLCLISSGCSENDGVSPCGSVPQEMRPFAVGFMEIAGLHPEGWTETYPGTFWRSNASGDRTVLVQRAYPGIDTEWLTDATLLIEFGPLSRMPDEFETRTTDVLNWRLYHTGVSVQGQSMELDVALAQTATHSYVVVLVSSPGDRPEYRTSVFLEAVDALTPHTSSVDESPYVTSLPRFDYDPSQPLDIQETGRSVEGEVTEIDLTFASPMGGRVPATLMVPSGDGPFPGMVYQHGSPSNRGGVRSWALAYAELGIVTIAIDAPWARPHAAGRSYPLTLTDTDSEEQVQLIVDLCRAVDLLVGRPDVDPEQLVYVGVSYGGAMGGLFAGVETRLKAYALVIGDGGLIEHFFGLEDVLYGLGEWDDRQSQRSWFESMWPVEPLHFVARADPAALLFQNGRTDPAVPATDAWRYQVSGSEPKTIMWYDTGHAIPPQMIVDQEEWLRHFISF